MKAIQYEMKKVICPTHGAQVLNFLHLRFLWFSFQIHYPHRNLKWRFYSSKF